MDQNKDNREGEGDEDNELEDQHDHDDDQGDISKAVEGSVDGGTDDGSVVGGGGPSSSLNGGSNNSSSKGPRKLQRPIQRNAQACESLRLLVSSHVLPTC